MKNVDFKVYRKFLKKNKLYTAICIIGFSISLMFVIILGVYTKEQLTVDSFQNNKDRIFFLARGNESTFPNIIAETIKDNFSEVEDYVRIYYRETNILTSDASSTSLSAKGLFADPSFFDIFSFKLLEGDIFASLQGKNSIILSQSFGKSVFGKENPIGKYIRMDGNEYIVTGIMENMYKTSQIPKSDYIANYSSLKNYLGPDILTSQSMCSFNIYFLGKEGINLKEKEDAILNFFKDNFWLYIQGYADSVDLIPFTKLYFTNISTPAAGLNKNSLSLIFIYGFVALLVLIIAVFNYINMTIAQSGFRCKEIAIKKFFGNDKKKIIKQLLGESFILTSFTFLFGLILAFIATPFFQNILNTEIELHKQFNWESICFIILFIIFISYASGLFPAIVISDIDPLEIVKGNFYRKIKIKYSKILIIIQYTIAIILLICSFVILKQTNYLTNYNLGFEKDNILIIPYKLNMNQKQGIKSDLENIVGVELVSFSQGGPFIQSNNIALEIDGQPLVISEFAVDDNFFNVYGIKYQSRGILNSNDSYWLNRKAFHAFNLDSTNNETSVQLAGIIDDIQINSLHKASGLLKIRKIKDDEYPWIISVRINKSANIIAIIDSIKDIYSQYNGGNHIEILYSNEIINDWYKQETRTLQIIVTFTILIIIIMMMGVFAISLYQLKNKQKEIGIRKINGATVFEVLVLIIKDTIIRVTIAFIVACPITYFILSTWLNNFAFKIKINVYTFLLGGVIVFLLSVITIGWISWKTAIINPIKAIKNE